MHERSNQKIVAYGARRHSIDADQIIHLESVEWTTRSRCGKYLGEGAALIDAVPLTCIECLATDEGSKT
jgi:hypothetical protein